MTKVLVTGGSGFLGSWVVDALLRHGYQVRIFDKAFSRETVDRVCPGNAGKVDVRIGDVTDAEAVFSAAEGCSTAIHLAGVLTVFCRANPVLGASINMMGAINLFEAALRHGLRNLAYVSSAGVFGPDDGKVPQPSTHYGAHKLAVEGIARSYYADHGLSSVGFRPYVIYGPGEGSGISAGPSAACRAALKGEPYEIKFNETVGFVHVKDVAEAFVAAIGSAADGAAVYNLQGETADVEDYIAALKKLMPGAAVTATGPRMPIASRLAEAEKPAWLAALPVTGLEDGVKMTLSHLQQQLQLTGNS